MLLTLLTVRNILVYKVRRNFLFECKIIFSNDLDAGAEFIPNKFAGDTKLGGVGDSGEIERPCGGVWAHWGVGQ